jgi:lipopolysaccharide biosynthesis glycosyltransferase
MPLEVAAKIIKKISAGGYKTVFVGTGHDTVKYAENLRNLGCEFVDLVNKTTIPELGSVLKNCDALISVDTGTMHYGYALGVPTTAVFYETTTPKNWAPDPKLYNVALVKANQTAEKIYNKTINLINGTKPEMNKIAVCFGCDNNYVQHMAATISSILKHKTENEYIKFYILDGGITKQNKKKLEFFTNNYNCEISYIKPNLLENLTSSKKIQLTFKEAIQLNKLRNSWYPEEIIKKCCIIKYNNYNNFFTKNNIKDNINENNEIDLNLNKYIFGFDETILKFIKRSKIPIPDKKVTRKNFNIKLIPPEIHWSEKITEKLFKYSMERKDYEKLFDLPLNEWETFILKLLPKIKEHSSNLLNDDDVREKSKKRGTFNFTNNLKSNVNLKRFQKQLSEKKLIVQQQ